MKTKTSCLVALALAVSINAGTGLSSGCNRDMQERTPKTQVSGGFPVYELSRKAETTERYEDNLTGEIGVRITYSDNLTGERCVKYLFAE